MALSGKLPYMYFVFSLFLVYVSCLESNNVATEQGKIIGFTRELVIKGEKRTTRRFLGIPYAKPPVGERRFKKPQDPEKFTKPFEALEYGASCPQVVMPMLPLPGEISEDCLFLNIFVPTTDPDQTSGYPVMIYVHGGGFDFGTGSTYVSDTLAASGNVIVVTFNYRLGLFGFFSTKDENAPGNAALWDQNMAFKWVNKNIGAFGGDKDRVTIFGESAGGVSVMMQALYPGNKGLFQRVIAQSGTALMWSIFNEDPISKNVNLAEVLKCDVTDVLTRLNEMNASEIINVFPGPSPADSEAMMKYAFRPVVDNDFFKISPFQMAKNKTQALEEMRFFQSLDVMNGVCSDEAAVTFSFMFTNTSEDFRPTREMVETQFVDIASLFYANRFAGIVTKLVLHEYTDWSDPDDPKVVRAEISRLISDLIFNVGATEQSRMHCNRTTAGRGFFFIFDTDSDTSPFPKPIWSKGAVHGEDIGFLFGFDKEMMAMFNASDLRNIGVCERKLSERFMRYWSNFAAYGDPNGLDAKDSEWPEFDLDTQKAFVISEKYSGSNAIHSFPYARAVDFWRNIVPSAESLTSVSGSCSTEGECDDV